MFIIWPHLAFQGCYYWKECWVTNWQHQSTVGRFWPCYGTSVTHWRKARPKGYERTDSQLLSRCLPVVHASSYLHAAVAPPTQLARMCKPVWLVGRAWPANHPTSISFSFSSTHSDKCPKCDWSMAGNVPRELPRASPTATRRLECYTAPEVSTRTLHSSDTQTEVAFHGHQPAKSR